MATRTACSAATPRRPTSPSSPNSWSVPVDPSTPPKTSLWQTGDLAPKGGRCVAPAARCIGDAWGLLAPVQRAAQGGDVAAQAGVVFMLTRVMVDEWRELRFASGGAAAQAY